MKIFVDENIPLMTVKALRQMDHDVKDIRGSADEGISDRVLWQKAQAENRLVITTDKGFSQYRDESHYGILIICLKQPNRKKIHRRIIHAINHFSCDDWNGLLVIMRDTVQSTWKSTKSN
jgi:predicted nuclease of predicted toxin-antitoxin system